MLTWIREKFGTAVIGGIITLIAFVFVFYGVFNPKATRGLHEGAVAGTVNGDPISISEFNQSYRRRVEYFKNMMGGQNLSDEQLRAFHLKEGVFQELVRRKLMAQASEREGLQASAEEVKEKIQEIPAFQANGHFDLQTYKKVLAANNYSPGSFERLMKEDLSVQKWEEFFKDRAKASDDEVKQQFAINNDKRNIKYVLLTTEAGRRDVKVEPAEIQKFLNEPAKLNLAKSQFEGKKDTAFKGKTFDQVKDEIARDVLASEKTAEVRKANEKIADEVAGLLKADKASDGKVDAKLKSYGVTVKTTGLVTRQSQYLPGIGESRELMADAFAPQSPIDATHGGQAKKYTSAAWVLVALVTESQKPDLAQLDTQRDQLIRQITARKERDLYEAWVKKLTDKAKIDMNQAVVGEASAASEG